LPLFSVKPALCPLYDERYNPAIADAIDAAYPRRERRGSLTLHLPR
jgi:hypothetical protein